MKLKMCALGNIQCKFLVNCAGLSVLELRRNTCWCCSDVLCRCSSYSQRFLSVLHWADTLGILCRPVVSSHTMDILKCCCSVMFADLVTYKNLEKLEILTFSRPFTLPVANRNTVSVIHKLLPCAGSGSVSNSVNSAWISVEFNLKCWIALFFMFIVLFRGRRGQCKRQMEQQMLAGSSSWILSAAFFPPDLWRFGYVYCSFFLF